MDNQLNDGKEVIRVVNRGVSFQKLVCLLLVTVILSALIGASSILLILQFYPGIISDDSVTNVTRIEKEVTVTDTGIADAVEKVYDSVVVVKTYRRNKVYATGTGFVYKRENNTYYLITNYHVIQDGDRVDVVFTNGVVAQVQLKGGDKYSDIAVLTYTTDDTLSVAKIGSSVDMRVGDTVFAIGAPLDSTVYSWSVTRGVLSGKDREVEVSTNSNNSIDWIMQVIQTDAAINSGNSGGPLCNSNGEVVGITNMKLVTQGVEGMGFAIPIEEAGTFADAIINNQDVSRPRFGATLVSNQLGVLIDSVYPNSSAEAAGLQKGDIVTGINGEKITSVASLRFKLYKYKVGDVITVEYIRRGKIEETKLKLI